MNFLNFLFKRQQPKGRVERAQQIGGLTVFKVYLTDDPNEFPFIFLEPSDTDETTLIKRAAELKKLSDEFGLA